MKPALGSLLVLLTLGLLTLGLGLAAGCAPTQGAGPTLEEAVADPRTWPSCITRKMQERAFACPTLPALAPAQADCAPRPTVWPPELPPLAPSPELARQLGGTTPLLDRAEGLYAETAAQDATKTTWRRAQRAFERLQRNRQQNEAVRGYAAYRLGLIHLRLGRNAEALTALETAVRLAHQAEPSLHTTAVRTAARSALIVTAATEGDLDDARQRFHRLWGSEEEAERWAMLQALGDALAAQGKLALAAELLSDLARQDGVDGCAHQVKAVRAQLARGRRLATARALDDLMGHLFQISPNHPRYGRCGGAAAELLVQIGDAWHAEALGSPGHPGTQNRETMHLAAQLYRAMLATFHQAQLDEWGVCAPLGTIALKRADLLRARQQWQECGPAYERAIRLDPRAARDHEVVFAAVVCRQHAWAERQSAEERTRFEQRMESALEHTDDWRQLLRSIHRYLCTATAQQATQGPSYADSALVRAQALYDGGALWESAVAFRLVAFEHSHGVAGGLAAQRYAEVMEPLAADDVCRRELSMDLARLDAMYCHSHGSQGADPRPGQYQECRRLADVLIRLGADGMQL
ncbi:MAG: tetratricopeptide repeat protein [Deltaproteobacteria bacterium]|nr:tetratricopeptide repeat protein [Deltaproteobacteria bacterium]